MSGREFYLRLINLNFISCSFVFDLLPHADLGVFLFYLRVLIVKIVFHSFTIIKFLKKINYNNV